MKISEVAQGILDVYAKPNSWTQGSFAKVTPRGRIVSPESSEATCLAGAAVRVLCNPDLYENLPYYYNFMGFFEKVIGVRSAATFNVDHCESKKDVIAALEIVRDCAICEDK